MEWYGINQKIEWIGDDVVRKSCCRGNGAKQANLSKSGWRGICGAERLRRHTDRDEQGFDRIPARASRFQVPGDRSFQRLSEVPNRCFVLLQIHCQGQAPTSINIWQAARQRTKVDALMTELLCLIQLAVEKVPWQAWQLVWFGNPRVLLSWLGSGYMA